MVCRVICACIKGLDVDKVIMETDVTRGLPGFDMVGLLSSDVRESKERVRSAIRNSGFLLPPKHMVISIIPGNVTKKGTHFDLPVAISVMTAAGLIADNLEGSMFIGELSLTGEVMETRGVLAMALKAREFGVERCFVPKANLRECRIVKDVKIIGVGSLLELIMLLEGGEYIEDGNVDDLEDKNDTRSGFIYDFSMIKGLIEAKRAAVIAACGMHNLLMISPPGNGKSILAKAMAGIMPDMDDDEYREVARIHTVSGDWNDFTGRPFRSPHHTVSAASMTARGYYPKPGELSLAHCGILFMDEFPEFDRSVIEVLRQPLEEGEIRITRSGGDYIFPARFLFSAAMNPCRCGYYPDRKKCTCTEVDVNKYQSKVSGPILDRMDLCVYLKSVSFDEMSTEGDGKSSRELKAEVERGVLIQKERFKGEGIKYNSEMNSVQIEKYCTMSDGARELARKAFEIFSLGPRGYTKLLKVSRTIADLAGHEDILEEDIAEAMSFRTQIKHD